MTANATRRRSESGLRGWRVRIALVCAAALGILLAAGATSRPLEGDPFRGRILFTEKRCVMCHSVWGHGGGTAPEILRAVAGKPLPQLAGEFWNHTPRMIDEMQERGYEWPSLDRGEMADLLSYLYYLRLFGDPGDAVRGAATYARLGCGRCHSLGGEGRASGGPLDGFSAYPSSVPLAQAMWNAGPRMRPAQRGFGLTMPKFSGTEMNDIQAYIRERGFRTDPEAELLPLPDPSRGAEVFAAYRCRACHGNGTAEGPDLGQAVLELSIGELSGALWNHSYAMQTHMQARGIPFPRFRDNEMADLIAYLHYLGYLGSEGDAARGLRVFRDRGCGDCHEGDEALGPELGGSTVTDDALSLSAAMWNHAPQMHDSMAERSAPWPRFEPGDMEDLAAYLGDLTGGRAREP